MFITRRNFPIIISLLIVLLSLVMVTLAGSLRQPVQAASLQSSAACTELLSNGNLEASDGWTFTATPNPATIVNSPVHAGSFAIRLGNGGSANVASYSTAYQSVALPADAQQIVLTYWERPGSTGDSGDLRDAILFRPDFTMLRPLDHQTGAGTDQWAQRSFDLSDLAGQTVVLYFSVYNNGSGSTLVNYLDDLALQSCDSDATTPTATLAFTPTPTQIATPTPTATATPLSNSVRVQVSSSGVNQGQAQVQIALDLLGARDEFPVGVVSLTLQYDAAKVKATDCATSARFDLLRCNIAKSGVIQLAGVDADGIRSDARIADITFEILQAEDLYTPLTLQLRRLANRDGDRLDASAENGQIGSACAAGSGRCIYLPVVQR